MLLGASALIWMSTPAWIYLVAIFYQNYKGDSPLIAALYLMPAPVTGLGVCVSRPLSS